MSSPPQAACNVTDPPPVADVAELSAAVPSNCPPPMRCRDIAAAFAATASPWELPDSPLGTHGWCWGTGEPLYLLNGHVGCAELYALWAWLLKDRYRCVMINWHPAPGQRSATLDDFVDDLAAVTAAAGDQTISIYGPGFGAAVATRFAARQPQRTQRLVLQGLSQRRPLSWVERTLAPIARRSQRRLNAVPGRAQVQSVNHRRWFPPLDPDRWKWFLEITGELPLPGLVAQAVALDGAHLDQDFSRVTCPVLLINTEGAGPRNWSEQLQMARQFPDARTAWMHTAGWHPYLTHPHRLMKLITPFLDDPAAFDAIPADPPFLTLNVS